MNADDIKTEHEIKLLRSYIDMLKDRLEALYDSYIKLQRKNKHLDFFIKTELVSLKTDLVRLATINDLIDQQTLDEIDLKVQGAIGAVSNTVF